MGIEKRLYPRRDLRTKVVFEDEFGEGLVYLYSENISVGGLFLASDIPIKLGSYIFLSFYLPNGSHLIRTTSQVVRISGGEATGGGRLGMGIRFVGLADEAIEEIQSYVSG